jgi:hypothetical protein
MPLQMTSNEDNITDKDRFYRYSEDWRFHHKLIWEIPSVASAIFIGILTISYLYLDLLPRTIALGVGAALMLGLTFTVRKHRFGADLRTNFLYDISNEDRDRFPIRSHRGSKYLNENEVKEEEHYKSKDKEELKKKWYPNPEEKAVELQKLDEYYEPRLKPKKRYLIDKSSEVYLIWFCICYRNIAISIMY